MLRGTGIIGRLWLNQIQKKVYVLYTSIPTLTIPSSTACRKFPTLLKLQKNMTCRRSRSPTMVQCMAPSTFTWKPKRLAWNRSSVSRVTLPRAVAKTRKLVLMASAITLPFLHAMKLATETSSNSLRLPTSKAFTTNHVWIKRFCGSIAKALFASPAVRLLKWAKRSAKIISNVVASLWRSTKKYLAKKISFLKSWRTKKCPAGRIGKMALFSSMKSLVFRLLALTTLTIWCTMTKMHTKRSCA